MSATNMEALRICATSIATSSNRLGAGTTHTHGQCSLATPRMLRPQRPARKTITPRSSSDSHKALAPAQGELKNHFVAKIHYQLIDNRKTFNTFFSIKGRLRSIEFLPLALEKLYFRDTMRSFHTDHSFEQERSSTDMAT